MTILNPDLDLNPRIYVMGVGAGGKDVIGVYHLITKTAELAYIFSYYKRATLDAVLSSVRERTRQYPRIIILLGETSLTREEVVTALTEEERHVVSVLETPARILERNLQRAMRDKAAIENARSSGVFDTSHSVSVKEPGEQLFLFPTPKRKCGG